MITNRKEAEAYEKDARADERLAASREGQMYAALSEVVEAAEEANQAIRVSSRPF